MAIDLALLRPNPTFRNAPDEVLREALAEAHMVELPAQEVFINAGDKPTGIYVLVEGQTRVFHRHETGREVTVKHLDAPCTLGEMQALAGMTYVENAETMTPSVLVWIGADRFEAFLKADHRGTLELLKDVCTRFCVAARNEAVILFEVPVRLASLVLAFADLYGKDSPIGLKIHHRLTHSDLADGLGVTRKSVNRTLSDWKAKGWMTTHKGWLVITDVPALEEVSGGFRFNINYRAGVEVDPTRQRQ